MFWNVIDAGRGKLINFKKTKMPKTENFLPLMDRVLVATIPKPKPQKNTSGIILPDNLTEDENQYGLVVQVGPGRYDGGLHVPVGVKKGDKVMLSGDPIKKLKIAGIEHLLFKEEDLLLVIA